MRTRITAAAFALAVSVGLVGCGEEKTVVPTNLSQPTPPKPGAAGGGGGGKTNAPQMPQGKAD